MSLQSMVMSNQKLANALMSRMSSEKHLARGQKRALEVANTALARTTAYPAYLAAQDLTVTAVPDVATFQQLPVIDKKSYVDAYDLSELCLDGRAHNAYTIEKSSGHAGGSYYWLRLPEEDAMFPSYLEFAFVQFYGMDTKPTLVLITLALGTWTSGEKMAQALRQVAATGKYPLTVMAPGTNTEEILEIVTDLGPHYEQVVVVGYPPFLKTVVDEGTRRGIDWKSLGMKLGLGGEGYSEQWRDHMGEILGIDTHRDLLAISGGYGAADVGMTVGREYPLTVLIRKLCTEDNALAQALFKDDRVRNGTLPALLQYNPATIFLEEVDSELVFTVLSGVPLVRYNIHDSGGLLDFDETLQILADHGYDVRARLLEIGYGPEQFWRLPFFYVFGRSDGTVSVVGANIHPDNIQAVLSETRDSDVLTFKLSVLTDEAFSQRLAIALEHHDDLLSEERASDLAVKYHAILVAGLYKINQDFRDAYEDNPEVADPLVTVHAKGSGPFGHTRSIKNQYIS